MKKLFLFKDPEIDSVDMQTLVGIANAIEHEAVRRYAMLADQMDRQGEATTAAAFRVMLEEERIHVEAVSRWAEAVGHRVPAPEGYGWRLPEELSSSWSDVSGSSLLTPYRAFAIAVENEQRAFSFYTYLAARAQNARVMTEAEKLATEELHHAALLRRFRRRAWHRDQLPARVPDMSITSIQQLQDVISNNEGTIARQHRAIEQRLRDIGDDESARLLEDLARLGRRAPVPDDFSGADTPDQKADIPFADKDSVRLLTQAQKPLEAFSETLEAIMSTTEGERFELAEAAMVDVVKRIARLSLQTARRIRQKTSRPTQAGQLA